MEKIQEIWKDIWQTQFINSIVVVLLGLILYRTVIGLINNSEKKTNFFLSNKGKTYIKLIKSILRYIFILVTIIILLQINGIDVSSILAGVGILGVVLGLAIQDWLKDIIRGTSILSDNYFSVGDIVKYKDIEGRVLVIGLKTTKIQDLALNNVISIANRNIEEIQVISNIVHVNVPMPYGISLDKAEDAINDITKLIKGNDNVNDCRYLGVTELADSSIQYLLEINCNQQFKLQVRRDALRSILAGLADNNIEVPFTQIDIHNK